MTASKSSNRSKGPSKSRLPVTQRDSQAAAPADDLARAKGPAAGAFKAIESKPVSLLLDLSGDMRAARNWATEQLPGAEIRPLDKSSLKWNSRLQALARVRASAPDTFAIFSSDLKTQSARGAIVLFAALSGARRIVFGDQSGNKITRSRAGALLIEGPRLALELASGYALLVPLSWLLTTILGALLRFRPLARTTGKPRTSDGKFTALYVRATVVSGSPAGTGGMATHVAGFARGAHALGHRLKFLASGEIPFPADAGDIALIRSSSAISATRALFELWNNLAFSFRALRQAREWLKGDGIDFIYQRYSRFNWTGVALSLVTGLPLVLEFNGSEVWVSRHWDPVGQLWLLERFERLNQRAADLIFVVSEVERRNLIDAGINGERIVVNPNGVDTDEFQPGCGGRQARAELGLEGRVVVGFLGTFGPWHGAPVLAKASRRVSEEVRCHFLFIGDGEQRGQAQEITAPAAASFVGRIPHDKVRRYLDASDILVSPHVHPTDGSEFFGSPTKLFEYMAMARPVVASRLGQIGEIIIDDINGLLVEPGDPNELADAIERLAKDKALRERLGGAARQTVIDHYTWRHNAARVFEAAKRLIERY